MRLDLARFMEFSTFFYILWGYTTIFNYVINVVCEKLETLKYALNSLREREFERKLPQPVPFHLYQSFCVGFLGLGIQSLVLILGIFDLLELGDVETLVDDLRDGPDFGSQLALDLVQGKPIVIGDQVDCDTKMAKAPGSANPVQVSLRHLGEIKVDHDIDSLKF